MNNGFDCSQERERMIRISPLLSKSALNLKKPFLGLTNSLLSCEGKDQLKIIIYPFPRPNFKRVHLNRRNVCLYAKARTVCGLLPVSDVRSAAWRPLLHRTIRFGASGSAQRSPYSHRPPSQRPAQRRCPSFGLEKAGMAHAQRRPLRPGHHPLVPSSPRRCGMRDSARRRACAVLRPQGSFRTAPAAAPLLAARLAAEGTVAEPSLLSRRHLLFRRPSGVECLSGGERGVAGGHSQAEWSGSLALRAPSSHGCVCERAWNLRRCRPPSPSLLAI